MRDFASSAVTFRQHDEPPHRAGWRGSSSPSPRRRRHEAAAQRDQLAQHVRLDGAEAVPPACAKISFTRLPSRRSRYVSISTEGHAAGARFQPSRTDVFPRP